MIEYGAVLPESGKEKQWFMGLSNKLKKNFQDLFDNIFQNIEINIRELGYGDTKVNNTMKNLNKGFK